MAQLERQPQPSVELRRYPRHRVSAPFACAFCSSTRPSNGPMNSYSDWSSYQSLCRLRPASRSSCHAQHTPAPDINFPIASALQGDSVDCLKLRWRDACPQVRSRGSFQARLYDVARGWARWLPTARLDEFALKRSFQLAGAPFRSGLDQSKRARSFSPAHPGPAETRPFPQRAPPSKWSF